MLESNSRTTDLRRDLPKKKSGFFKKLFFILGGLIALLLVAIVAIPFLVDVDSFRPQIVAAANQHINGELKVGKLKLTLWGQIRVQVDGIELVDAQSKPVLKVRDTYLFVPLSSLWAARPELQFHMGQPELNVVKNAQGKLNVMTLIKETAPGAAQAPSASKPLALPVLVTQSKLGIYVKDAKVLYEDAVLKTSNELAGLNLNILDISLTSPTTFELFANLNSQFQKTLEVAGPFKIVGKIAPRFENFQFKGGSVEMAGQFSDLQIHYGKLFTKPATTPLTFGFSGALNERNFTIENFKAQFANAEMNGKVLVERSLPKQTVTVDLKSNAVDLAPWAKMIPMLEAYALSGIVSMEAHIEGPTDAFGYSARLTARDVSAKAPHLKHPPVIQAAVVVKTNEVEKMEVTVKSPGCDVRATASVKSFTEPSINLAILAKEFNLDKMMELPPLKKGGAAASASGSAMAPPPASAQSAPSGGAQTGAANYDAMLDPIRNNATLKKTRLNGTMDLENFTMYGETFSEIRSQFSLDQLLAQFSLKNLRVFQGVISSQAKVNLAPAKPQYQFAASVSGLNLQSAVESQFELFKNTLLGKLTLKVEGSGESLNPDPAKRALRVKGDLKVLDGVFATIDVGRMVSEAINEGIEKAASKLPQLKGKKVEMGSQKFRYEVISSNFSIEKGIFSAPNFTAKAVREKGFDIDGRTNAGIIDYSLDAKWKVKDTYNLSRARDLNVEVEGVKVDPILAKTNEPVILPITVGCKLTAPCYSYGEVAEHFVSVALSNLAEAAKKKLTGAAQEKAKSVIDKAVKQAPKPAQDAAKKLLKKFGL